MTTRRGGRGTKALISPGRLVLATRYAIQGMVWGARNERAIQQELLLVGVGSVVGVFLPRGWIVKCLLVASLLLVLVVEFLNTAIEVVVDKFGDANDELSGIAKDLGAAAVFVALLIAVVVWVGVLVDLLVDSSLL